MSLASECGVQSGPVTGRSVYPKGYLGYSVVFNLTCRLRVAAWHLVALWHGRTSLRQVVLGVFTVFASIALWKGLDGEISCGGFGRLEVSPWWAFGLDLFVLAVVSKWQPVLEHEKGDSQERKILALVERRQFWMSPRVCITSAVVLLFVLPATFYVSTAHQTTISTDDGLTVIVGGLVILEPEKWVNQPLPIASQIDI